jgi:hypothetical protein
MKIYLFNTRQHIYESFKWLLAKCEYNWKTLDVDEDNDDDYYMLIHNDSSWANLNRHDAKTWEEIIRNRPESKLYCLVHIWVPDDKALMFKLRWG